MALNSYAELISAVKELLALPDAPVTVFISQAEADFRSIRHRYMEKTKRVSMAANVGSIAEPDDYLDLISIRLGDRLLDRMSRYKDGPVDDNSYYLSDRTICVRPVQTGGVKLSLVYRAKIPTLSEANPSNWLLEEFPMVYLHATMMHAYEWLRDVDGENASRARFGEAVAQLNLDNKRSTSGGNLPVLSL